MGIAQTLRHRGLAGVTARAYSIVSRFGVTRGPMERRLDRFVAVTGEFGVQPSLPITASVLARCPALIRQLVEREVEFAIHGLVHNDHAVRGFDDQRESIGRAARIFEASGVPYSGFRGPYLRFNQATNDAVRACGLLYHSSQPVLFDVLPAEFEHGEQAAAFRRPLEHLYRPLDAAKMAVRPRSRQGLIDIPVALPDDEIMVERLHLDVEAQAAVWLGILDHTYLQGELFTLQLHPERIYECTELLRRVLAEARQRKPEIWIARLDQIASWWQRRSRAKLEVTQISNQRFRVNLEGDPEATLLLRGLPQVAATSWSGHDQVARAKTFEITSAIKPVVGVTSRSPEIVRHFLSEEGFPIEVSDDPHAFGAYVDIQNEIWEEAGLLAEIDRAPGPLVRLWRWPGSARSALAVTGDIDSITLQDFALRLWETRR